MKPKKMIPMLWTNDIPGTIDFYTNTLNFVCGDRNDEWNWVALYNDDVDIMIAKPNEHTLFEKPAFTGSFYFIIDNAVELWTELKNKVKVAYELETFDWNMKEFAIYDNNGYMLQFGQDIKN